jgi:Acetyltransferase (GNAT) domain
VARGRLAQLGEHLPYKQGVAGSSPAPPISTSRRSTAVSERAIPFSVMTDLVPRRLVPDDFVVPDGLGHERFKLRMLSVTDVAKDFAAINQRVLADGTPDPWSDTSFLDNLADLGWHEVEFRIRRSFAYTVVRPDESEVIGCVYFNPPRREEHDVEISLWVTSTAWKEGLDGELETAVREWVERDWPFERPNWRNR